MGIVLAHPSLHLFAGQQSAIIGIAELTAVGSQALGALIAPSILWWTSQLDGS
jgi:hypothetical protein